MFKVIKYSIFVGVFLTLAGCGTKIEILPEIVETSKDQHIIYAKFDSNKTYMKKYLPSNVIIKDDAPISVEYNFTNIKTGNITIEHNLTLEMKADLKFFNNNKEINITSFCNTYKHASVFSYSNYTKFRKVCIPEIQKNLQKQINIKFEKGEFNVFK